AGDAIKSTSVLEYTNDALSKTTSYKGEGTGGAKQSVTLFSGNEGEEKAQRTYNYNFAGDAIKSTSVLEYTNDALSKTTSYKGEGVSGPKQSVTEFSGNEGEEKAQRTFNYNFA